MLCIGKLLLSADPRRCYRAIRGAHKQTKGVRCQANNDHFEVKYACLKFDNNLQFSTCNFEGGGFVGLNFLNPNPPMFKSKSNPNPPSSKKLKSKSTIGKTFKSNPNPPDLKFWLNPDLNPNPDLDLPTIVCVCVCLVRKAISSIHSDYRELIPWLNLCLLGSGRPADVKSVYCLPELALGRPRFTQYVCVFTGIELCIYWSDFNDTLWKELLAPFMFFLGGGVGGVPLNSPLKQWHHSVVSLSSVTWVICLFVTSASLHTTASFRSRLRTYVMVGGVKGQKWVSIT